MDEDLIKEDDVFKMIGKKRSALFRLRKKCGFPEPIFNYPSYYSRSAIEKWKLEGGVHRK